MNMRRIIQGVSQLGIGVVLIPVAIILLAMFAKVLLGPFFLPVVIGLAIAAVTLGASGIARLVRSARHRFFGGDNDYQASPETPSISRGLRNLFSSERSSEDAAFDRDVQDEPEFQRSSRSMRR